MKSIFLIIALIFTLNANATTEADCKSRIVTSMENAKGLGGNQADEERWGRIAANDCIREVHSQNSTYSKSKSDDGGFPFGWLIFFILVYWMWYRPDVNGWVIPFVTIDKNVLTEEQKKENEEIAKTLGNFTEKEISQMTVKEICKRNNSQIGKVKAALLKRDWNAADFDAKDENIKSIIKLRDELGDRVKDMTVEEISNYAGSSDRSTRAWLVRRGLNCKNYDGEKVKKELEEK